MSEITRRDAVRRLGLAFMATGLVDRIAAQEVHHFAAIAQAGAGGTYKPLTFTAHQFKTLERLTDLIIPIDDGRPGALAAGCAAWIDMICTENAELQAIYRTGFTWMDEALKTRGAADFVSASPDQQTALLDRIAFRATASTSQDLAPGIEFFTWVRRMTVDAFYTSEIGIKDIDYRGNAPMAAYPSPTDAIAYALKRTGL